MTLENGKIAFFVETLIEFFRRIGPKASKQFSLAMLLSGVAFLLVWIFLPENKFIIVVTFFVIGHFGFRIFFRKHRIELQSLAKDMVPESRMEGTKTPSNNRIVLYLSLITIICQALILAAIFHLSRHDESNAERVVYYTIIPATAFFLLVATFAQCIVTKIGIGYKLMWLVFILLNPIVGPIVWLLYHSSEMGKANRNQ